MQCVSVPARPAAYPAVAAAPSQRHGLKLGPLGKALGALMDLPVPTSSPRLTSRQVDEVRHALQPGDVLLETNDEYPGWEINAKQFLHSDWVHAAMYMGHDDIIDSTTERNGVAHIDLPSFCDTHHIAVLRPQYKTPADRQAALDYCTQALGTPYDYDWSLNNQSLYCTELVYNALKSGPHPINIPLTGTLEGPIVSPQSFMDSKQLALQWSNGCNFWSNMASHARPLGGRAAIGALAGLGADLAGLGPAASIGVGAAVGGGLIALAMYQLYRAGG